MWVLRCTCGHEVKVAPDTLGRSRICPQCRASVVISKANTRADDAAPAGSGGGVAAGVATLARRRIGELLVKEGLVTEKQLAEGLETQKNKGGKLVDILITYGYLKADDFVRFLAKQPGIASIELSNYQIPSHVVALVPGEIVAKHEVFPIDKMGKLLTLGMACPLDGKTIDHISEITGLRVKPILCSPRDIREAIRRYYPDFALEAPIHDVIKGMKSKEKEKEKEEAPSASVSMIRTGLKLSRVAQLIQELKSLPALPATVEKVREAMSDLTVSPRDIAQAIVKDPPIAAKVLSVANSAAYGFPSRVASVELAVALLGLRETYSIVLSAAVLNIFDKSRRFDYKAYWEEAMNSAAAAKAIAKSCGKERDASIFTAGLLHDIGRIALLETVPEMYVSIPPDSMGEALVEAELDIIGLAHTEAGYELATRWQLPVEISEPIRFHHSPGFATEATQNVAMVALAELWMRTATAAGADEDGAIALAGPLITSLGISAEAARAAYRDVASLERVRFAWESPS